MIFYAFRWSSLDTLLHTKLKCWSSFIIYKHYSVAHACIYKYAVEVALLGSLNILPLPLIRHIFSSLIEFTQYKALGLKFWMLTLWLWQHLGSTAANWSSDCNAYQHINNYAHTYIYVIFCIHSNPIKDYMDMRS